EPQAVQRAAVRALASHPAPDVATILLRNWRSDTPAVRGDVLQALLGREAWVGPLLDAVEDGTVEGGQVPATRRGLLMASENESIRERAGALFGADAPSPRKEVIARYQEALRLVGHRDAGQKVFERECLTCHRLGEKGHAVGPNLASVQRRTPDEIL